MKIGTDLEKSSFLSPVKNISVLLLIGGIILLIKALFVLLFSIFSGIILSVIAIGSIAASFGLRHMKKWAFYAYIIITLIGIASFVYSSVLSSKVSIVDFVITIFETLILFYLWKNAKKFN